MLNIPAPVALRIARKLCDRHGVELILPDDPRRLALVVLVAQAHRIQGTGVTYDRVRDGVTTTLPGVPSAASSLLSLVPAIGPELAQIARTNGRPAIYPSPEAMADGARFLATMWHELGHVGTIRHGGLAWCLAYLVADEARAAGEAPCFGAALSAAVAMGADVDTEAARAKDSLTRYGLGAEALATAHALIDSARESVRAGDFGGVQDEVRAELAAEGIAA
jgi:hypothetical protein